MNAASPIFFAGVIEMEPRGGLLGQIPAESLKKQKPIEAIPPIVRLVTHSLAVPGTVAGHTLAEKASIVGSFAGRVQPFPGDVDINSFVLIEGGPDPATTGSIIARALQDVAREATSVPGVIYSDAKAGAWPDGRPIHWTQPELLAGKQSGITLEAACGQRGSNVIKIDVLVPLGERYIEMTAFFRFLTRDGPVNYIPLTKNGLAAIYDAEIAELLHSGSYLKAAKRGFSRAQLLDRMDLLKTLAPLIASSASNISSAASALTAASLALDSGQADIDFIKNELGNLAFQLSTILDIPFDPKAFATSMELIANSLVTNPSWASSAMRKTADALNLLANKETLAWLRANNMV